MGAQQDNNSVVNVKKPKSLVNPKTIVIGSLAGAASVAAVVVVGIKLSKKGEGTPPAPQPGTGGNDTNRNGPAGFVDTKRNGPTGLEGNGEDILGGDIDGKGNRERGNGNFEGNGERSNLERETGREDREFNQGRGNFGDNCGLNNFGSRREGDLGNSNRSFSSSFGGERGEGQGNSDRSFSSSFGGQRGGGQDNSNRRSDFGGEREDGPGNSNRSFSSGFGEGTNNIQSNLWNRSTLGSSGAESNDSLGSSNRSFSGGFGAGTSNIQSNLWNRSTLGSSGGVSNDSLDNSNRSFSSRFGEGTNNSQSNLWNRSTLGNSGGEREVGHDTSESEEDLNNLKNEANQGPSERNAKIETNFHLGVNVNSGNQGLHQSENAQEDESSEEILNQDPQQKERECAALCKQIKDGINSLLSSPSQDKANKLLAQHTDLQSKCNGVSGIDSDISTKSLAEIARAIFEKALIDAQNAVNLFDIAASELQKKLDGLRYLNPDCKYNSSTAKQILCDHHFAQMNEKIMSRDFDAAGKEFNKAKSYCKEDNTKQEFKKFSYFYYYVESWIKTTISKANTEDSALKKRVTDILAIKECLNKIYSSNSFSRIKDEAFTNFIVSFKGLVPEFNAKLESILKSENLTQSTFDEFKGVWTTLTTILPVDYVFLDARNEEEKKVYKIIEDSRYSSRAYDKWIGDQLFEVLIAKLGKALIEYKEGSDLTKITNLMSSMVVGCKSASDFPFTDENFNKNDMIILVVKSQLRALKGAGKSLSAEYRDLLKSALERKRFKHYTKLNDATSDALLLFIDHFQILESYFVKDDRSFIERVKDYFESRKYYTDNNFLLESNASTAYKNVESQRANLLLYHKDKVALVSSDHFALLGKKFFALSTEIGNAMKSFYDSFKNYLKFFGPDSYYYDKDVMEYSFSVLTNAFNQAKDKTEFCDTEITDLDGMNRSVNGIFETFPEVYGYFFNFYKHVLSKIVNLPKYSDEITVVSCQWDAPCKVSIKKLSERFHSNPETIYKEFIVKAESIDAVRDLYEAWVTAKELDIKEATIDGFVQRYSSTYWTCYTKPKEEDFKSCKHQDIDKPLSELSTLLGNDALLGDKFFRKMASVKITHNLPALMRNIEVDFNYYLQYFAIAANRFVSDKTLYKEPKTHMDDFDHWYSVFKDYSSSNKPKELFDALLMSYWDNPSEQGYRTIAQRLFPAINARFYEGKSSLKSHLIETHCTKKKLDNADVPKVKMAINTFEDLGIQKTHIENWMKNTISPLKPDHEFSPEFYSQILNATPTTIFSYKKYLNESTLTIPELTETTSALQDQLNVILQSRCDKSVAVLNAALDEFIKSRSYTDLHIAESEHEKVINHCSIKGRVKVPFEIEKTLLQTLKARYEREIQTAKNSDKLPCDNLALLKNQHLALDYMKSGVIQDPMKLLCAHHISLFEIFLNDPKNASDAERSLKGALHYCDKKYIGAQFGADIALPLPDALTKIIDNYLKVPPSNAYEKMVLKNEYVANLIKFVKKTYADRASQLPNISDDQLIGYISGRRDEVTLRGLASEAYKSLSQFYPGAAYANICAFGEKKKKLEEKGNVYTDAFVLSWIEAFDEWAGTESKKHKGLGQNEIVYHTLKILLKKLAKNKACCSEAIDCAFKIFSLLPYSQDIFTETVKDKDVADYFLDIVVKLDSQTLKNLYNEIGSTLKMLKPLFNHHAIFENIVKESWKINPSQEKYEIVRQLMRFDQESVKTLLNPNSVEITPDNEKLIKFLKSLV